MECNCPKWDRNGDMKLTDVTKKQLGTICETFMFNNMEKGDVLDILNDERTVLNSYCKDEVVFQPEQYSRSLAYVLKGTAEISMKNEQNESFPMRKIEEGSFFGVAALFNAETRYVTEIRAVTEMTVIFFRETLVEYCIRNYPDFAMNYVRFLGSRIQFLNRKISLLANSSSENSLITYLMNAARMFGEEFVLDISYTELAKNLNMGRSSLYRSLDDLENKGFIRRDGRKITLVNHEALRKK